MQTNKWISTIFVPNKKNGRHTNWKRIALFKNRFSNKVFYLEAISFFL